MKREQRIDGAAFLPISFAYLKSESYFSDSFKLAFFEYLLFLSAADIEMSDINRQITRPKLFMSNFIFLFFSIFKMIFANTSRLRVYFSNKDSIGEGFELN